MVVFLSLTALFTKDARIAEYAYIVLMHHVVFSSCSLDRQLIVVYTVFHLQSFVRLNFNCITIVYTGMYVCSDDCTHAKATTTVTCSTGQKSDRSKVGPRCVFVDLRVLGTN